MSNKTENEILRDYLLSSKKSGFDVMEEEELKRAFEYCEGYKQFLNVAKTERLAAAEAIRMAKENGFKEFDPSAKLSAGDKIFVNNKNKSVILAVMGTETVDKGVNLAVSHIDSPRLDLKQHPLFENNGVGYLKTHYYGGIKKFQWVTIPLAIYGTVLRRDGESVEIAIGDGENDPVFCISDLLPHLGQEQMTKPLHQAFTGEGLNVIFGSVPLKDDKLSDKIKVALMKLLNERYGIVEDDFMCAEIEIVPQGTAKDVGLDRALIGAYGHDDRVCAYPSLTALLELEAPVKTAVCVLADKEETGSDGNTGMQGSYLEYFLGDLAHMQQVCPHRMMENTVCFSADVNAAFDPNYPEVSELNNSVQLHYGMAVTKYTGSRGKSGTSDASAEFMNKVRLLLDGEGVLWQTGELGKVDQGGGGTVAKYVANLGPDVVDVGIPVLSMHAPFEIVSKIDVYMGHKAFSALYHNL
ncbi:MAG: aminopeptidase [Clostridia bacterium]|nr:aminopeptidase [Clostridia bacterium]